MYQAGLKSRDMFLFYCVTIFLLRNRMQGIFYIVKHKQISKIRAKFNFIFLNLTEFEFHIYRYFQVFKYDTIIFLSLLFILLFQKLNGRLSNIVFSFSPFLIRCYLQSELHNFLYQSFRYPFSYRKLNSTSLSLPSLWKSKIEKAK